MCAILYIIAGPVAAFVPWYSVFLLARIGIGIAGSGTYHTAYTICKLKSLRKRKYL